MISNVSLHPVMINSGMTNIQLATNWLHWIGTADVAVLLETAAPD